MCQVSGVMRQVICIMSCGQSGDASQWMVCYQRGLPRLVFFMIRKLVGGGSVSYGATLSSFLRTEKDYITKLEAKTCIYKINNNLYHY